METIVESDDDGKHRTYVGVAVCRGPRQMRLLLTRPHHEAGRIVEIPRDKVESVTRAPMIPLGEEPRPSDG